MGKTDYIVIGSGIAGLRAAIDLAESGRVTIFTKAQITESNSMYAQGGIAAAIGHNDDVEQHYADLEGLEQRLTVLEEKMLAVARTSQTEEQMLQSRQELDRQLRPYRGKMTADQLSMLEKQYLERNLLEKAKLPRLSLFYLR